MQLKIKFCTLKKKKSNPHTTNQHSLKKSKGRDTSSSCTNKERQKPVQETTCSGSTSCCSGWTRLWFGAVEKPEEKSCASKHPTAALRGASKALASQALAPHPRSPGWQVGALPSLLCARGQPRAPSSLEAPSPRGHRDLGHTQSI